MTKRNEIAVQVMRHLCTCPSHGYSQPGRYGTSGYCEVQTDDGVRYIKHGDRDCSSSTSESWAQALKGTPWEGMINMWLATYTMKQPFLATGLFEWKPMSFMAQPGDLYLKEGINGGGHVAMCIQNDAGGDILAEFLIDENGDSFEEFIVYHPKFITWMNTEGIEVRRDYTQEQLNDIVARSPYYKATSNDVDWVAKVKMQGDVQKWVDHSISVTINLPNDISEEMVGKLYVEAWRSGCKGCTVYRDGSRTGVLVALSDSDKKKEEQKEKNTANEGRYIAEEEHILKRPVELEADVVRFQNKKEKWIAFIGLIDGRPYEIFTGIADDDEGIFCPKSVTKGKIIKAVGEDGVKRYDFQFINKRGFKTTIEGLSEKFNPEFWNYAKLISGVLRYGMPIPQVLKLVSSLELDSQSINTWKMGVERALKRYINNGEASAECCPNCGQNTLVYQEGCLICTNCGTSRCG